MTNLYCLLAQQSRIFYYCSIRSSMVSHTNICCILVTVMTILIAAVSTVLIGVTTPATNLL